MNAKEAVLAAKELLENVTPLKFDCGKTCGAACCAADEDGQGGMVLFPGEEALYADVPDGMRLTPYDAIMPGQTLLTCSGSCDRSMRPLSCMLFPLTPVIEENDGRETLKIRMDPRAYAVCPLCEGGVRGMDAQFVQCVREAARILSKCPEHRAYFKALGAYFSRLREW